MPHNFHDTNGWLIVGIDQHPGLHWPIPTPFNMVPMPFWELNAAHPFVMAPGGDRNPTVQINGVESVKWECSPKLLWPHFPFAPDPLNLLFPLDVLFGVHKCWLPKTNVIAEGTPMTPVCIYGVASINMDCFMWTKAPTSFILQPGTVETTPTLGDYAMGVVMIAVNLAMDALFHALTGGFKAKKPVPPNTRKIANWQSLRSNWSKRWPTWGATARNRFRREVGSKLNPFRSWGKPSGGGRNGWQPASPAELANSFKDAIGADVTPFGWNADSGSFGLKPPKVTNLADGGIVDGAQQFATNMYSPLGLLP